MCSPATCTRRSSAAPSRASRQVSFKALLFRITHFCTNSVFTLSLLVNRLPMAFPPQLHLPPYVRRLAPGKSYVLLASGARVTLDAWSANGVTYRDEDHAVQQVPGCATTVDDAVALVAHSHMWTRHAANLENYVAYFKTLTPLLHAAGFCDVTMHDALLWHVRSELQPDVTLVLCFDRVDDSHPPTVWARRTSTKAQWKRGRMSKPTEILKVCVELATAFDAARGGKRLQPAVVRVTSTLPDVRIRLGPTL